MSTDLRLDRPPTAALPIPIRPTAGEHVDSFIRRLAKANHMPPRVLIELVHGRVGHSSQGRGLCLII